MIRHFIKILTVTLLLSFSETHSQNNSKSSDNELFDLPLEQLLQLEIGSASKFEEKVFDSPLSSYSISKEEILSTGVTSIPEALRLCPGVIVRQVTNGNYDIHIRGMDNINRGAPGATLNNLTLVMIDNRPVFNHNIGGTVWDALPISIFDIKRIEIIRGPSAPLFGPNAVTGVINLITDRKDEIGFNSSFNSIVGIKGNNNSNGSMSYKTKNLSFNFNGNFSRRSRSSNQFFSPLLGVPFFKSAEEIRNLTQLSLYPNPERALRKYGINGGISWSPNKDNSISIVAGYQNSDVTKTFVEFFSSLNNTTSESKYFDFNLKSNSFRFQYSYITGTDEIEIGIPSFKNDYYVQNGTIEYDFQKNKKLSFRPSLAFQKATYDDRPYTVDVNSFGNLNSRRSITSYTGSLRTEFNPTDKIRLVGAGRIDNFSTNKDTELSYQLIFNYIPKEGEIFRLVHSKSIGGSFVGPSFLDNRNLSSGFTSITNGDPNLKVTRLFMYEVGHRRVLNENWLVDFDLFYQIASDFSRATPISFDPNTNVLSSKYLNQPYSARQVGATVSVSYFPRKTLHIRPFITIQKTDVIDFPIDLLRNNTISVDDDNLIDYRNENTPSIYGGTSISYKVGSSLEVNINGYFFSETSHYNTRDIENQTDAGYVPEKVILNSSIRYDISKSVACSLIGRNLLTKKSREFFAGDFDETLVYASINLNLR